MGRTILVVEDNAEERKIFSAYLEFTGARMLAAVNGAEGLRLAREAVPDLILMDLSMPVLDGWETTERLRQDPATREIPVVAITAHHLPPERLTDAGFDGYLEKPLAPYRVLETVERFLGPITEGEDPAPLVRRRAEIPAHAPSHGLLSPDAPGPAL